MAENPDEQYDKNDLEQSVYEEVINNIDLDSDNDSTKLTLSINKMNSYSFMNKSIAGSIHEVRENRVEDLSEYSGFNDLSVDDSDSILDKDAEPLRLS